MRCYPVVILAAAYYYGCLVSDPEDGDGPKFAEMAELSFALFIQGNADGADCQDGLDFAFSCLIGDHHV